MDGDARGGAALSIRAVTGVPIKFIGTGEKMDAIEPFYPDRLASRILGMGDVLSLIERAQEQTNEEDAKRLQDADDQGSVQSGGLPGSAPKDQEDGSARRNSSR